MDGWICDHHVWQTLCSDYTEGSAYENIKIATQVLRNSDAVIEMTIQLRMPLKQYCTTTTERYTL
jgi:hypothetical protein